MEMAGLVLTSLQRLLKGLRKKKVVVQGLGQVGYHSVNFLHHGGAKIIGVCGEGWSLQNEDGLKMKQRITKISQNSAPYKKPSRAKSIGAIGQALHGLHGKQVCPLCKFEATTKNPYRHLQDHLGNDCCKTVK